MNWKEHVGEVISKGKQGPLPQSDVLWVFDAYVAANPGSAKGFPMVLKTIYDEDWCTEEQMLAYYKKNEGEGEPGFSMAKEKAAPFLKWLEENDDDDDDD